MKNRTNLKLVRAIFGALVVGSLGFGASQAFASSTSAARRACFTHEEDACAQSCESQNAVAYSCTAYASYVNCRCYF